MARCPTRIDFTGGFTDILPFRAKKWVHHINLAIDLPTTVLIQHIEEPVIRIRDENKKISIKALSSKEIPLGRFSSVKTALNKFGIDKNVSITIEARAPCGAGLGTSGALNVALVAALAAFARKNRPTRPMTLAMLAVEIEHSSGALSGLQDQFAAATGGLNQFSFYGLKSHAEPLQLSTRQIESIEQHMFILYPGGRRLSTEIATDVMTAYRRGSPKVRAALNCLNNLAPDIWTALRLMDWKNLSSLLNYVRLQQLRLHPGLIDAKNQMIINELGNGGINGVKLLGGGGASTCMLTICVGEKSKEKIASIAELHNIDILPVKISTKGVEVNEKF